ncbi:MAG: hypothetical protein NT080_01330 [Spirochaetes bacterium]|nr:hypothetical protein [Spirochaetota bacterium]
MPRKELESLVDFILNQADDRDFEVVLKACERRQRDRALYSKIGGLSPNAAAGKLAQTIEDRMGSTMEGMRARIRGFVSDIIRKNAPEIPEEQLDELLSHYVPDPAAAPKKPADSPLPPDAIVGMVRDFTDYAEGRMAPSRQQELWEQMPRWQDSYWNAMPGEVRAFVKAYLEGRIELETMWSAVASVLGV